MSNISVDYDILNQKQTPAFYASSLATRPAFGFPGRIFIDTDTPSSGIYRDTGSAWVQVADPGAGTTGTLQQVTTNGNTTTLGVTIQGIDINDGAGTGVSNTAIGLAALQLNTTGAYNTAIGYGTLQANTTGGNNVATGYYSLFANTTGVNNVAIGYGTLQANTTGSANTGVGYLSLSANTTAGSNTSIGHEALRNNTTGAQNTAIGHQALRINTTGQYNVSIGQDSLANNIIGSNNTAIGQGSLRNNTTNNNTAIGFSSLNVNTTGTQNTAIGVSALLSNTTGSSNTAIGYNSLNKNTTSGQNTAIGYLTLGENTSGTQNTSIGYGALALNTTGFNNTAIGSNSLAVNTTGNNNTAIGIDSLNVNTGSNNTAIGRASLTANTTGTLNTAIGYNSGNAITTGSNNTILGNYVGTPTLASNIVLSDGVGNVRLFSDANGLIGINQAVGSTIGGQLDIHSTQTYALVLNGLSTSNAYTAFSNANVGKWRIGNTYNAGANSFDIYNLGTSSTALSFNSTTNNIGIGTTNSFSDANYVSAYIGGTTGGQFILGNSTGGSANRYLQLQGDATGGYIQTTQSLPLLFFTNATEKMRITAAGNVGIGTSSPAEKLEVVRTTGVGCYIKIQDTGGSNYIGTESGNMVFLNGSAAEKMRITSGGNVLIGTTTDLGYKLQASGKIVSVNDSISSYSSGNGTTYGFYNNGGGFLLLENAGVGYFGNFALATGIYTPTSDINKKKDFELSNLGLNEILNLKPTLYRMKTENNTNKYLGFIAQEVKQFIPQAFVENKDFIGLDYQAITATLVKAIQELNEKLVRNNIN